MISILCRCFVVEVAAFLPAVATLLGVAFLTVETVLLARARTRIRVRRKIPVSAPVPPSVAVAGAPGRFRFAARRSHENKRMRNGKSETGVMAANLQQRIRRRVRDC